MIRFLSAALLFTVLSLSLSACGDDGKSEKEASAAVKKVEEATSAPAPAPAPAKKDDKDMTPAQAVDNMKRDAGVVADKAVEGYNAAKDAVTKAMSE